MLITFFQIELLACISLVFCKGYRLFAAGIFLIGLSVSTIQYVSIFVLADVFPVSGSRRIGWITGFYSFGDAVALILCGGFLEHGLSWKFLFAILAAAAVIGTATVVLQKFSSRESGGTGGGAGGPAGSWMLSGILALGAVIFAYVGFENGFAFFCLPLGFFCGAVYPSVLIRSLDFAGGKTATATGIITAATGLGGVLVTAATGIMSQQFGLRQAIFCLAGVLAVDVVLTLLFLVRYHSADPVPGEELRG